MKILNTNKDKVNPFSKQVNNTNLVAAVKSKIDLYINLCFYIIKKNPRFFFSIVLTKLEARVNTRTFPFRILKTAKFKN